MSFSSPAKPLWTGRTAITYDASGNPLSYRGMSFTWENGKQLSQSVNGSTTTAYAYDADGMRTAKAVGNNGYVYIYDGDRLVSQYSSTSGESGNNLLDEIISSVLGSFTRASETLEFLYDESGAPYGFIRGVKPAFSVVTTYTTYYYVTDLQGDIVGIVDESGSSVASYTYNAWGEIISSSGDMAETNPLRYRGYYYDTETNLYYLQSRYYDPATCRFINADDYSSTGQDFLGNNPFAYCLAKQCIR